jgi:hypothetical protein
MLVQHCRPDVDDAERVEAQEEFLHTGQKKCGLGEGPLPSSGSPWVTAKPPVGTVMVSE